MTFVVFALPRSRTFWASRFLSAGQWFCGHDEIRHARTLEDIESWFAQDYVGSVETAGAAFWRLLARYAPNARVATIRRPVEAVVGSLMATGLPYDRVKLEDGMRRIDRKLDQIEARLPNVLSIRFEDMGDETVCAALFKHCLQLDLTPEWFATFAPVNLQENLLHTVRYMHAYRNQIDRLAARAKFASLSAMRSDRRVDGSISIAQEPFDNWIVEGRPLLQEHQVQIGAAPDDYLLKNLPLMSQLDHSGHLEMTVARDASGRMLGYLMALAFPSLESHNAMSAQFLAFYTAPEAKHSALGLKLHRAALDRLKARGISDVLFRASPNGYGPRLATIFRRLGAEPFGQMYRLELA